MPVNTRHNQYGKYCSMWGKVRDAIEGQEAVKRKRETYLPRLGGQTPDNYDGYLSRAQFYDISERTLNLALGQMFRKTPVHDIPEALEDVLNDIDLSGQSFVYFSKALASEIMQTNRVGVLVDWSDDERRPYMVMYRAESIINWQETGGHLSRVVLEGEIEEPDPDDKYTMNTVKAWRELCLEDGIYKVRDWRKGEDQGNKETFVLTSEYIPLKAGAFLNKIPFYMFTSYGINNTLRKPPLLGFVNLNYGHYKNSADYENMLHWTGAKTIVTRGMGKGEAFPVGGCVDLPVDGGADFLEASADSGLKDEMKHKEEQMATMGSALLAGKGRYVASAETAKITSDGEYATLADIANSLSVCMSTAMSFLTEWAGHAEPVNVEYNTDYEVAPIDPQTLTSLIGAAQQGMLSFEAFFYTLKNREMYPEGWTIEDERKELDKVKAEKQAETERQLQILYEQNKQNDQNDKAAE